MAARLTLSWKAPSLVAPSPKNDRATLSVPCSLRARPAPTAIGIPPATMPLAPRLPLHVGDVHGAAPAAAVAGVAGQQLGHHAAEVGPLGDAVAVPAVGRGDDVVVAQGQAGAGGRRLLADGQVHGPVEQAAGEHLVDRLLEPADGPHRGQHRLASPAIRQASSGSRPLRPVQRPSSESWSRRSWRMVEPSSSSTSS